MTLGLVFTHPLVLSLDAAAWLTAAVAMGAAAASSGRASGIQSVEPEVCCRAAALLARLTQDPAVCENLRTVSLDSRCPLSDSSVLLDIDGHVLVYLQAAVYERLLKSTLASLTLCADNTVLIDSMIRILAGITTVSCIGTISIHVLFVLPCITALLDCAGVRRRTSLRFAKVVAWRRSQRTCNHCSARPFQAR